MARLQTLKPRLSKLDTRTGKAQPPMSAEEAERERKRQLDRQRGTASQRGYDADWQALRDAVVIERGCRCKAEGCGRIVVLRKREATPTTPVDRTARPAAVRGLRATRMDTDRAGTLSPIRPLARFVTDRRTSREHAVIRTAPEGFVRITLSINAFGIDLPGLTVGGHWK